MKGFGVTGNAINKIKVAVLHHTLKQASLQWTINTVIFICEATHFHYCYLFCFPSVTPHPHFIVHSLDFHSHSTLPSLRYSPQGVTFSVLPSTSVIFLHLFALFLVTKLTEE